MRITIYDHKNGTDTIIEFPGGVSVTNDNGDVVLPDIEGSVAKDEIAELKAKLCDKDAVIDSLEDELYERDERIFSLMQQLRKATEVTDYTSAWEFWESNRKGCCGPQ